MAGINDVIEVLKTVANAYTEINTFKYDKTYNLNGYITEQMPLVLVDSMPDFVSEESRGSQFHKPIKKEYRIKMFIYDNFWESEKEGKELQLKQEELQKKLEKYIAEVQRYMLVDSQNMFLKGRANDGFFGIADNQNQNLVMIYETLIISAPVDCDQGTFNY